MPFRHFTRPAHVALAAVGLLAAGASSAAAADVTLSLDAPVERSSVAYACRGAAPMTVEYVNAGDNSLALVPVDGRTLVFVATLAASGVRYASGPYVWWTKGDEASLSDLRNGEDADPIATCEGG